MVITGTGKAQLCSKCDVVLIQAEQGQELCIRCVEDSDTGLRYNEGKLPYDLIPFEAEEGLARVLAHGAKKYAARNWEKGMDWSIPYGAMRRHLAAWWNGEKTDKESGLSHMAHVLCNAAFLITYEEREIGTDNRPHTYPEVLNKVSDMPLKDFLPRAGEPFAGDPPLEDPQYSVIPIKKSPTDKIEDGLKDPVAVQNLAKAPSAFRKQVACDHCGVEITDIYGKPVLPSITHGKLNDPHRTHCLSCFDALKLDGAKKRMTTDEPGCS